jgi:hypothetical protein
MPRRATKPSIQESRAYYISGEAYAVERAARYVKGRGYGKIVKRFFGSYLHKSGLGYVEHGTVTVVLVASPAVHGDTEQGVKLRGLTIVRARLGGRSARSAKKGDWHLGGTRCSICHKVIHTLRSATWYEAPCTACKKLGPLELLARVASEWEALDVG